MVFVRDYFYGGEFGVDEGADQKEQNTEHVIRIARCVFRIAYSVELDGYDRIEAEVKLWRLNFCHLKLKGALLKRRS
jgi:hypothetical protein